MDYYEEISYRPMKFQKQNITKKSRAVIDQHLKISNCASLVIWNCVSILYSFDGKLFLFLFLIF